MVDFWAFSTKEWGAEIMSMHHTRNALCRTTPKVDLNYLTICYGQQKLETRLLYFIQLLRDALQVGDILYTASMVPIMTFLEDTGPGVHDTTAAACRQELAPSSDLNILQVHAMSMFGKPLDFNAVYYSQQRIGAFCSPSTLSKNFNVLQLWLIQIADWRGMLKSNI